jgi:hypothetical protein
MGRRVDQQRNQFVKAVKAVRVAMRHHKRHRARTGAPLMNEVKARTVDCRAEMVELIENALLSPPVVAGAPVGDQVSQITGVNAVAPSRGPSVRRQTGVRQTVLKIIEHVIRNGDLEGFAYVHSWNAR